MSNPVICAYCKQPHRADCTDCLLRQIWQSPLPPVTSLELPAPPPVLQALPIIAAAFGMVGIAMMFLIMVRG